MHSKLSLRMPSTFPLGIPFENFTVSCKISFKIVQRFHRKLILELLYKPSWDSYRNRRIDTSRKSSRNPFYGLLLEVLLETLPWIVSETFPESPSDFLQRMLQKFVQDFSKKSFYGFPHKFLHMLLQKLSTVSFRNALKISTDFLRTSSTDSFKMSSCVYFKASSRDYFRNYLEISSESFNLIPPIICPKIRLRNLQWAPSEVTPGNRF